MKRLLLSLAVVAVAAASCQKDVVYNDMPKEKKSVELTATRSYDEALKIAESALSLLEGEDTRSAKKLYMNWGFDGIGNGWFYRGCFDMSERQYMNSALHSPSGEYDYNFSDISFFLAEEYPLVM